MKGFQKGFWGMVFYVVLLLVLICLLCIGLFAPARASQDSRTLPIIMYHQIVPGEDGLDDYTASAAQLEADLQALAREGYQTVWLSEVIRFVHEGASLPEKPVLLVFDDGYQSVISQVIPLLKQYNAKAMVSVIGARAQGIEDGCDTSGQYMTWGDLKKAVDSGCIELQSHSAQLHVFRTRKGVQKLPDETDASYEAMLNVDLNLMQAWAKAAEVPMLKAFAYPYGFVEPQADEILRQQGIEATMTSEPHTNRISADPACLYRMGRFNRSGLMDTKTLLDWLKR